MQNTAMPACLYKDSYLKNEWIHEQRKVGNSTWVCPLERKQAPDHLKWYRWGVCKREKILGNNLMAFSGSIREEATPLLCTIPESSYSWKFIWQLSIYTVFCVKHVSSWFWSAISIIWLSFSFNSNNMSNRFHLLECLLHVRHLEKHLCMPYLISYLISFMV